jgi:hypothetical protein
VWAVPRTRLAFFAVLALVTASLVPSGELAWAHPTAPPPVHLAPAPSRASIAPTGVDEPGALPDTALAAASAAPGLPWPAVLGALAAALATLALARRRPRRVVGLALVLLLAIFAYEEGLHSVHHGLEKGRGPSCALAAASAHLSATSVDGVVAADVIMPAAARPPESAQPDAVVRFLCPTRGRAPPSPLS